MKKSILLILFFTIVASHSLLCQQLRIEGRVRCSNDATNLSTRGAENVVVEPVLLPQCAVTTRSDPPGYFTIAIQQWRKLLDQTVRFYILTNCKSCVIQTYSVFVSEDNLKKENGYYRLNLGTKIIRQQCVFLEMSAKKTDSVVARLRRDTAQVNRVAAWVAAPSLLNLFVGLPLSIAAAKKMKDSTSTKLVPIKDASIQHALLGRALLYSAFMNSANAGFNFSPLRDFSEAVYWNPSSIFSSNANGNLSLSTDWRRQVKLAGMIKLNNSIAIGGGVIYSVQEEQRAVSFADSTTNVAFGSRDLAVFLPIALRLTNKVSVSLTGKFVQQSLQNPNAVLQTIYYSKIKDVWDSVQTNYNLQSARTYRRFFNIDISASYRISSSFQAGASLMNLFNSSLQTNYGMLDSPIKYLNQFSVGVGISYRHSRFNLGGDVFYNNGQVINVSFGASVVPFNKGLVQLAYSTMTGQPSLTLRYAHFKLSYFNSDGYYTAFTGQKQLHPYLYGGCSFDL